KKRTRESLELVEQGDSDQEACHEEEHRGLGSRGDRRKQRIQEWGEWVGADDTVNGNLQRQRSQQGKGGGQQAEQEEASDMGSVGPRLPPQPSVEGEIGVVAGHQEREAEGPMDVTIRMRPSARVASGCDERLTSPSRIPT